jgi:hypothetical protein
MRIEQRRWSEAGGWERISGDLGSFPPQVVLAFGGRFALARDGVLRELQAEYRGAQILGCSTAGEICGTEVTDETVVATAIHFESSRVQAVHRKLSDASESAAVGEQLAGDLEHADLAHVFVLAEGVHVNGSELVAGLRRGLPLNVAVTGGLAGDGDRFEHTLVCADGELSSGSVSALGLYGDRLRIGYGSLGGWDQFGPDRLVTRSSRNILYELDGESALALYKKYLGPYADGLPATGLLFPLSLRINDQNQRVVRTILGVNEQAGSLTFAGDIPTGSFVQLMKANMDRLIDGAHDAANACYERVGTETPDLAVLISCVGRKLVLKQRVEEEVESVRDVLGPVTTLSGFYSYGEIAPFSSSAKCELHNQTMTITTISER